MKKHENKKVTESKVEDDKYYCSVCGRAISKGEYETFDGMCWQCWDDQLIEEINTTEGNDEEFVPM